EHGDPDRAELIRLQCGRGRDDPAAARRAAELLEAHRSEWEAPFLAIGAEVRFLRGFPYFLKADLRRLAANLALLRLAPEWHFTPTREATNALQVEACTRLGVAPCADRLRGLNFAWAWCAPAELAALLTPAVVRAVRELRFGDDDRKRE